MGEYISPFYLGVDPGFTGAVAVYCPHANLLNVQDMPVTKDAKGRIMIDNIKLYEMLRPTGKVFATVEHVGAMPKQGVSSVWRFAEGYGALKMAILAHRIPMELVRPNIWKKHFGLSKDKGASRGLICQKFPDMAEQFARVKDDGRAEAALIAIYGSEIREQKLLGRA